MKYVFVFVFYLIFAEANGQMFKFIKHDSARIADKKGLFLPYPVLGYAPETKLQLGFGGVYSFYMDKTIPKTRSSYVYSYNMFSLEGQTQLILQGSFWTKANKWHMFASGIYSNFPINFYGVGANTKEADKDLITATRYRFVVGGERKLGKAFFIGGGFGLQSDKFTDAEEGGIFDTGDYVGKEGGNSVVVGYEVIYDTRDYESYTTKGSYFRAIGWSNVFNSDWKYTAITLDSRHFIPIRKNSLIGFQAVYQTTQGSQIPFYSLSPLGGSSYVRGYYSLRFSDQNLLAAQTEYKWRPWGGKRDRGFLSETRIIVAGFMGVGTIFPNSGFNWDDLFPSVGGGIRYMFDPSSRLTLRLDVAVGNKNPGEDRNKGLYISLNESF